MNLLKPIAEALSKLIPLARPGFITTWEELDNEIKEQKSIKRKERIKQFFKNVLAIVAGASLIFGLIWTIIRIVDWYIKN